METTIYYVCDPSLLPPLPLFYPCCPSPSLSSKPRGSVFIYLHNCRVTGGLSPVVERAFGSWWGGKGARSVGGGGSRGLIFDQLLSLLAPFWLLIPLLPPSPPKSKPGIGQDDHPPCKDLSGSALSGVGVSHLPIQMTGLEWGGEVVASSGQGRPEVASGN